MRKFLFVLTAFIFVFCFSFDKALASDETLEYTNSKEISVNKDSEISESDSYKKIELDSFTAFLNNFKKKVVLFSAKNKINEFYVFPFLAGLFLGPIIMLGMYLYNYKNPNRKAKMKYVFLGWTWWILIFSIILIL